MGIHKTQVRVRFGETDMAGPVYLKEYIHYFVVAWEELFRDIGFPFEIAIGKNNFAFPPVEVKAKISAPAYCGDLLEIETKIKELTRMTFVFDFKVFKLNEGKKLLGKGYIKAVTIDNERKIIYIPDILYKALSDFKDSP
ncbi:MAG: thioesterase family protein [Thermodesulfobacteriota bacterium]|nr:thioesterase family protein [Thermodesulfobacteriota bacterium]